MSDLWHPEGIYQCNGCSRIYAEYVNGCVNDHPRPRKVVLIVADTEVGLPDKEQT